MERIMFDEMQLKEAQKQISLALAELEKASWYMQGTQEELEDSCEGLHFEKLWHRWWKKYDTAAEGIREAEEKLRLMMQAYRNTEQTNIKLVEDLPCKMQEEHIATIGQEAPSGTLSSAGRAKVSRMLSGHELQHEAWVLQAVESVLYEGE